MDRVRRELAQIVSRTPRGAMMRSKAQWYEFGEKKKKQ